MLTFLAKLALDVQSTSALNAQTRLPAQDALTDSSSTEKRPLASKRETQSKSSEILNISLLTLSPTDTLKKSSASSTTFKMPRLSYPLMLPSLTGSED
jgi:hypothetical protein